MLRMVFKGATALETIKAVYAWMAENQRMSRFVVDLVVNRQPAGWEAVAYLDLASAKAAEEMGE